MSDELKRKLLEIYLENTEKGRTSGNWYHIVAESLEEDNSIIESLCKDLEDEECLEKETMKFTNGKALTTGIRITSKGKTDLQEKYNPEWVKQKNKEEQEEKDLRKKEVRIAESSHRWTKIGIVVAIIGVIASFIYTTATNP